MTKIDIVSGFLGAGKTTLIKKLLAEAYKGEKLVLIENEFGEINIDGGFLKESGIQISEMSAGCICCSLVGDFNKALKDVEAQFHPDRILIEPSGVGKLSDVIVAVENTVKDVPDMQLNSFVTVADSRMGSGKGTPEYWVAVVKPQRVMFEIAGVPEEIAREALRLASHKLPIKTKIVARTEEAGE